MSPPTPAPATPESRRAGIRPLLLAALVGLVHAGFSAYWALGGQALLDTVGAWAVRLAREEPAVSAAGLGAVALLKVAGAVIPPWVEARVTDDGRRRAWRTVEWLAGCALMAYGGLNTVVSTLVLRGVIAPAGGYDERAQLGHAVLWDPLFLLWGALLTAGLWRTRRAVSRP